ncbi:hypothetical protein [Sporosarcina sp. 6E9]|uniref:hypothetical protein n=1 Tax=Sporosarcina sp. 6E9 TaxID=2819235 RepID=UPI001AD17BF8|nr:hypothetical protein [Sporosarcina sp. 6E9]MBO1909727.1 hypothetical protein [Microvirga sp. 3-52]
MIELIVKDFLDVHLSVPAFTEKPTDAPKRYVLIDKIGSGESNHLPSAIIAFQSYAESKYKAAKLNEELKQVVKQLVELNEIRGLSLNGDYNFTDTTTKEYRYQAVYEIRYY